jgi:hypothetical protein
MNTTMPRILLRMTIGTLCLALVAQAAEPSLTDTYLFKHLTEKNQDGKEITTFYRIPSLVTAKDGTLLAFCNGRVGNAKDGCPYQTIVLRRSNDNGKTWEPLQTLFDKPGWLCYMGAAVVDDTTGHIFLDINPMPRTTEARDAYVATRPAKEQTEYKAGKWKLLPAEGRGLLVSKDYGATWKALKLGKDFQIKPNVAGRFS